MTTRPPVVDLHKTVVQLKKCNQNFHKFVNNLHKKERQKMTHITRNYIKMSTILQDYHGKTYKKRQRILRR